MTDKQSISSLLGITIIGFITAILITNALLFMVGSTLSGWTIPAAALATFALVGWLCSRSTLTNRRNTFITVVVIFCILLVVGVYISNSIYDISFDGQTYHSEGIIDLAHGWNPFQTATPTDNYYANWLRLYAKGPWITAAAMYRFTGNIESGKVFNFLVLIASGLFSYDALATFPNVNRRWRMNLSLIMALNPVSLYQLFTFYVDGQLSSCLIILVCLLILLNYKQNRLYLLALGMMLIIITNIKLTAILYAAIFVIGFIVWQWWRYRGPNIRFIAYCVVATSISLGVVGFNPVISQFTRNLIEKHNPLYPYSWSDLILIDNNMPRGFIGKDRFWKLAVSLFSKSQVGIQEPQLKIPFTFSFDELFNFRYPDARTGGFGPLFSGALLLAVVLVGFGVIQYRNKIYNGFVPILLALIIISVLSTSEAWWARWSPQFWLIPILIVAVNIGKLTNKLIQGLAHILILVLVLNIILVASTNFVATYEDQQVLHADLENVKQIAAKRGTVPVVLNIFPMTQARFEEENIPFTITNKLPCTPEEQHSISYSWSMICNTVK